MKANFNLNALERALNNNQARIQAAVQEAMTRTALDVRDAVIGDMRTSIDRPTPFTVNPRGWYFKQTVVPGQIRQRVGILPKQAAYLQFLIKGIPRDQKIIERRTPDNRVLVPTRFAPLDRFGNVPKDYYLRAFKEAFSKKKGGKYFFAPARKKGLFPGIYERKPKAITPIFFAYNTARDYGKKIDLQGIAERTIRDRIQFQIDRQIRKATQRP
jgi:hypothetical protein